MQLETVVGNTTYKTRIIRVAAVLTPSGAAVMPHKNGQYFGAICCDCGFGAVAPTAREALELLSGSYANPNFAEHDHFPKNHFAHMQVDPALIDHIYEAYSPDVARA